MGKRTSKQATADDFTTTTTVPNTIVTPVTTTAGVPEVVKPTAKDIVVTSKDAVKKHLKALDTAVNTVKKGFLAIGYNLYWFKDTCAFQEIDGKEYATIDAFAKDRYDISKSTCHAYIAVIDRFGKPNPETGEIDSLQDEYKDYSPTALITMCAMDNETLALCSPKMRVKDLKALMNAKDDDDSTDDDGDNENDKGNNSDSTGDDNDSENDGDISDDDINSEDSRLTGQCLLHINTVEELENKKEYVIDVMKRILTQQTSKKYTVGILQIEPPIIAGQQ